MATDLRPVPSAGRQAFARFTARLRVPVIAAPMLRVSGLELVEACCRAGVIGAFPTANCRTAAELEDWLVHLNDHLSPSDAPFCPNLIMRSESLDADLDCLVRHRVEVVITSVGSPARAVAALRDIGCLVLADVASIHHARRALEAGAHGLVLLAAGAGGQTGWANPFAFVRAVRAFFDGPLVLAGGMSDGASLHAARVLGCDLGYLGTSFIATAESRAEGNYKAMLVASSLDDVMLTKAFTGLETNMLRPSIIAAGLNPDGLSGDLSAESARAMYGAGATGPQRWRDVWSAGHTVSGVVDVPTVKDRVERLAREYRASASEASGEF